MTDSSASSAVATAAANYAQILLTAITPIVLYYLGLLASNLLARFKIKLSLAQQAQLDAVTKSAVLKAEELAARGAGVGAGRAVDKLQAATQDIVTKLPNTTQVQAEDAIHAMLPQLGLGASSPALIPGAVLDTAALSPAAPAKA